MEISGLIHVGPTTKWLNFGLSTPLGRDSQGAKYYEWQFDANDVTAELPWATECFYGQIHPDSQGAEPPVPQNLYICDLYAPDVIAGTSKFGKVTYHDQTINFRSQPNPLSS